MTVPTDHECWDALSELVPYPHTIVATPDEALSAQGTDYLGRMCSTWETHILTGVPHTDQERETAPPVQHEDEDCWVGCGEQQGHCDWCGGGLCCRLGWDDRSNGCDGTFGGAEGHVCSRAPQTGVWAYSHFRFNLDPAGDHTGLRDWDSANSVQLAEITLLDSGGQPLRTGLTCTNPGGNNPSRGGLASKEERRDEGPAQACDGSVDTKWLDYNRGDLVMTFEQPQAAAAWSWVTADDSPSRDPVRWTFEGSNDGLNWEVIDSTASSVTFETPGDRHALIGPFSLQVIPEANVIADGESLASLSAASACQLTHHLNAGGNDMYDIGNLLTTSLMGTCDGDPHDCEWGSLLYHSNFEPVDTNCFGPSGSYQMHRFDGMWVFFTHVTADSPVDFMIRGNLGADGSGTVQEFVFEEAPFIGFVKRQCGSQPRRPSVNHMIIVDSTQARPTHTCDYENGGECTGADSDLDDDIVRGIAPGSPIVFLLYSNDRGRCMKEDQHHAIFDVAKLCIRAADPFSAINQAGSEVHPLVEVDVDSARHITFGGTAPFAGWAFGAPRLVPGPTGHDNALAFGHAQWLELGDDGSGIDTGGGDWTLDCYVQVAPNSAARGGTLLEDTDGHSHVSIGGDSSTLEFGTGRAATWTSSGISLATLPEGWHRLTVTATAVVGHGALHVYSDPETSYRGCYHDPNDSRDLTGFPTPRNVGNHVDDGSIAIGISSTGASAEAVRRECADECREFRYFGLQWTHQCMCGNSYHHSDANGPADECGDLGELCGMGNQVCGNLNAVFEMTEIPQSATTSTKTLTFMIDGQHLGSALQVELELCGDVPCAANFFSVGGRADGSAPFPLPVHRLRIYDTSLQPDRIAIIDSPGQLLQYHSVDSRNVKLSRGTDALEVTWDTFGWSYSTHQHVSVSFGRAGDTFIRCDNVSSLWDRAVRSASHLSDGRDVMNYSAAALPAARRVGLRVRYVDSDPCFDLWNGITCSLSDWPVGSDDCAQRLECGAIGWSADANGVASVCGSSHLIGGVCVQEAAAGQAAHLCVEMGGRLCTVEELVRGEGDPAACDYATIFRWTWASTPAGACPQNHSLGVAGGIGKWYSFTPLQANVIHEIQLRSATRAAPRFSLLGVFDADAELVRGRTPSLHQRLDGVMLRWNASRADMPFFVHASSEMEDPAVQLAVSVVVPPTYQSVPGSSVPPSFGATDLHVQHNHAVPVDLPFEFPFFGLRYSTVWVASAGYLTFEEPVQGNAFTGTDTVHSAVLSAAGDFDTGRTGARVTATPATLAGITISWHAPLFASSKFSDVSVSLSADGSIAISWDDIELESGGSLRHLVAWSFTFDMTRLGLVTDSTSILADADHSAQLTVSDEDSFARVFRSGELLDELMQIRNPELTALTNFAPDSAQEDGNQDNGAPVLQECSDSRPLPSDFLAQADAAGFRPKGCRDLAAFCQHPEYGPAVRTACRETCGLCHQDSSQACNGGTTLRGDSGTIDFMHGYAPHADCTWLITCDTPSMAPIGRLTALETEESWDYVTLYDGSRKTLPLQCSDCEKYDPSVGTKYLEHGTMRMSGDSWSGSGEFVATGTYLRIGFTSDDSDQRAGFGLDWRCNTTANLPQPARRSDRALALSGNAHLQLPEMTLGGSLSVGAWVALGQRYFWNADDPWPGHIAEAIPLNMQGWTLFNSFQSSDCGNTDPCRNAVGGILSQAGWLAFGNGPDPDSKDSTVNLNRHSPEDLWAAGVVFGVGLRDHFWRQAVRRWTFVSFVVSEGSTEMQVSIDGALVGTGTMQSPLPRMLRSNNYVGAAVYAPWQNKGLSHTMAVNDFMLFDRGLAPEEVAALHLDPSSACCIVAGVKDAFGVNDVAVEPAVGASVTIRATETSHHHAGATASSCTGSLDESAERELDICGAIRTVNACTGWVGDGVGPYSPNTDCGIKIEGMLGMHYEIHFHEFETEPYQDWLTIFDGDSEEAPELVSLTGNTGGGNWYSDSQTAAGTLPDPVVSTSSVVYVHFSSNAVTQFVGFKLAFQCIGEPIQYWRPADTAELLQVGALSPPSTLGSGRSSCVSDVLMSVQCCADATMSCANARVTAIDLESNSLRGSVPEDMSKLSALRSIKLHDNFLTGTLPSGLSKLHLLRELQLSHNQFTMQGRDSLSVSLTIRNKGRFFPISAMMVVVWSGHSRRHSTFVHAGRQYVGRGCGPRQLNYPAESTSHLSSWRGMQDDSLYPHARWPEVATRRASDPSS